MVMVRSVPVGYGHVSYVGSVYCGSCVSVSVMSLLTASVSTPPGASVMGATTGVASW